MGPGHDDRRCFEKDRTPGTATTAAGARHVDHASLAPATTGSYAERTQLANRVKSAALILHDVGSKDERKDWVEDFKAGRLAV